MIETSAASKATVNKLWATVSDVESWPGRLPTFTMVEYVEGPKPTDVGTKFRVQQPTLKPAIYEITVWEPGRRFVWVSDSPALLTTASHAVERAPGSGSKVHLTFEWTGKLAWLMRLLGKRKARKMVESEARHLAEVAAVKKA